MFKLNFALKTQKSMLGAKGLKINHNASITVLLCSINTHFLVSNLYTKNDYTS